MSKTKTGKTNYQRGREAASRRQEYGYKVHQANPDSVEDRRQGVLIRSGKIVDDRYPATREPIRRHFEQRTGRISKKAAGLALAVTAAAGAYGVGLNTETSEAPNPGNMESFSDDPLQDDYRENPDNFMVEGGEITPLPLKGPVPDPSESSVERPIWVD